MGFQFRFPVSFKQSPDQLISKMIKLDQRLKSYSTPVVVKLTDYTYWQQISGKLGITFNAKIYETQTISGQAAAYSLCPIVTSIVTKRGDNLRNGRWCFEDDKGNEVTKGSNPLFSLLKRPNPLQDWGQFITQAYAFRDIFGVCYILPLVPVGGDKTFAKSLYIIPNWLIEPRYTGKTYLQSEIEGIISEYRITGFAKTVKPSELITWYDNCINASQSVNGIFQSRLYPLGDQISNFNAAYSGRRNLIEKGGALGMWVNDNAKDAGGRNPITPKEKEEILTEFQNTYGLEKGKSPFAFTSASIRFERANYPTKDLMLFEEIKDCAQVIAAAYNLSPFDLPWADQTTYTNKDKTDRALYQNVTIPDAESLALVLKSYFQLEENLKVYFDHIDCLQKSKKEEADALSSFVNGVSKLFNDTVITKEEYRILISEFLPQGAAFDPLTPTGKTYYSGGNTTYELTPKK
jgi:hypothetical protein